MDSSTGIFLVLSLGSRSSSLAWKPPRSGRPGPCHQDTLVQKAYKDTLLFSHLLSPGGSGHVQAPVARPILSARPAPSGRPREGGDGPGVEGGAGDWGGPARQGGQAPKEQAGRYDGHDGELLRIAG